MATKHRSYTKEYDLLEKLKRENKKLKKDVQRLRKELDKNRVHFDSVKDLMEQQAVEEIQISKVKAKETLLKKWKCHKCEEGVLKLIIVPQVNEVKYFRKCTKCTNRTKLKTYTSDIEGITDV